jgi:hypothetical protein
MELKFSAHIFEKNTRTWNFMKICSVGSELFYSDERTDRNDEVNNHFSLFCERAQQEGVVASHVMRYDVVSSMLA